jgi:hypothetical protein
MTQDDNNYCGMFDQHNSQLNNNQSQFIHGFNLNNYQVLIVSFKILNILRLS